MTQSVACASGVRFSSSRTTAKERDTESDNDYFGARYYASSMGRWLSPDWSVKAEPIPYAKMDDPQSMNLYTYVGNNPLVRFDADGHFDGCNGSREGFCDPLVQQAIARGFDPGFAYFAFKEYQKAEEMRQDFAPWLLGKTAQQQAPKQVGTTPEPIISCFAQLKYRPTAPGSAMNHASWYVQGSNRVQHTLTGGPDHGPSNAPPSGFLNVYDKKPEDLSATVSFDSGLSHATCKAVDAMIMAADRFRNNTVTYNWQGPNSNSVARYLGDVGGFSPAAPPGTTGWRAPILGVEQ